MPSLRYLRTILVLSSLTALAYGWSSLSVLLTRGPYLQDLDETGTTVVFQTPGAAHARVRFGRRPGPPWERELSSAHGQTHVVELAGLLPDTPYHYAVEVNGRVVAPGGEGSFRTAPPPNSRRPFRFLAWGDSGTGTAPQIEVARRMEQVFPPPDFALGLGDLVYPSGQAENFDPRFFQPYAELLRTTPVWVTIGNHDAATAGGAPFLDAFHLPTDSGAPGHPSNTELYYSFNYGMAHFVCVDSQVSSDAVGSAMHRWIADDLDDARRRAKRWLIVFMHHPPYTKGTHDSDAEADLVQLRQNLVPLFESRGVDLVLSGHSHVYERSFLARADAILQADTSTYTKVGSPDGTIYLVNGCGGQSGSGSLDHPLMAYSAGNVEGVNVFDVGFEEIHGFFLRRDGTSVDLFSVRKAADVRAPRIAGLRESGTDELHLTYTEPVLGQGSFGAETLGNYSISPSVAVLEANLLSDQRTVALTLAPATPYVARRLSVLRCEDLSGNRAVPVAHFVGQDPSGPGPGQPPVAVIEVDRHTANAPALIRFEGGNSADVDGAIVASTWDFGDGATTAGAAVEHLYPNAGVYSVTLVVRDDAGLEALATREIRILALGSRPTVSLAASATDVVAGQVVEFDAAGSADPDGGPVYVHWDFGDSASGAANHSASVAESHAFRSSGTRVVTLTITDDEGSSETATLEVEVEPSDSGGACSAAVAPRSPWDGDLSLVLALCLSFACLWRAARRGRAEHACA